MLNLKKSLLSMALILGAFSSFEAFATNENAPAYEDNKPYLYKRESSGFVPEDQRKSLECGIYKKFYKVVVNQNGRTSITAKKFILTDEIKAKIAEAHSGAVTYQQAPADIGDSVYGAYHKELGASYDVDLGSILDSQTISTNSSPAAAYLKKYIDAICVL